MVDSETLAVSTYALPASNAYGIGMDQNGHPWFATYASGPGADFVYRFDPDTATFHSAGGLGGYYRGMNVDREGRVWVAGNSPCRLAQFDLATEMVVNDAIALPGCVDPVGVSVDRDGYVWVVDRGASVAWKVDPTFHIIVGMASGLVNPYTYSDMTGQGLNLVVNPPG
jgi:streptogramin lyase